MARTKKETAEKQAETLEKEQAEQAETSVKKEKTPKMKKLVEAENKQEKTVRRGRKPVQKAVKIEEKAEETVVKEEQPLEVKKENSEQEKAPKPKRAKKQNLKKEELTEINEVKEEKPTTEKKSLTRAEKNTTIKALVKETLGVRAYKWSELLEEIAKGYQQKIDDEEGKNANDLRGRIGSVVDVMKKDGEVVFDGGMYALKTENPKTVEMQSDKKQEPEQTQPKKEEKQEEKTISATKEIAKLSPVFDMSLLLGKKEENKDSRVESKPVQKEEVSPVKKEEKEEQKVQKKETTDKKKPERKSNKNAEEKLKESFLKKIRSLGGSYFEYYSIYLLERYSLKNGRRVESMRISGGEYDGGIDGEIEVTDRIGFKEKIYIQAKNWNPMSGKDEGWVVGETHLQQFIGAVCYRQAKEGKQHSRGIFITTSYFTNGAKEMLDKMSDKFIGYDGDDLFEAAKDCSFGVIQKDGQWVLDEKLLSGDKAFFNLY